MENTTYFKHEVPESYLEKWQHTVNLMAGIFDVPAGLIMRVLQEEIEVLAASKTEGNPYEPNEKAALNTGLYCETVMSTRSQLFIENALEDDEWRNNPDVKLNMIFYLGVPLVWPDGSVFGTICVLDDKRRSFSKLYQDLLWQFKDIIETDFQLIVQAEKLQEYQEHLEDLVEKRTLALKQEISKCKQAEDGLKQAHEQLLHAEKLSAIGRFSASITHEINNPLQGVLNVIRGVQERATLTEKDQKLVGLAVKECHRMRDLIENLQQFNKPTSGIRVELNIHQLIDNVLLFVKKEFKNKKITIKKEYAASLPAIWAVSDQIKQVFVNILGNAADAIGTEGGTITLTTILLDEEHISISIKDSGEGIRPENIKEIFEPFHTTKAIKGMGLGLSVSYGIIKSHDGNIGVESEVGQGATFTITLPIGMKQ